MRETKTLFSKSPRCCICGSEDKVATHEIFFGTANRRKSIEDGMVVNLCGKHHNLSSEGVHSNRELDLKLKKMGQNKWEKTYGDRDAFIKRYGKSWL